MVYSDKRIEVGDTGVRMKWYYFPFGTKTVAFNAIDRVLEHDMGTGAGGGRWRIWGSGDLKHWMPLDSARRRKTWMYIFILNGSRMRPCLTPDEPEAFKAALTAAGVSITPATVPYQD